MDQNEGLYIYICFVFVCYKLTSWNIKIILKIHVMTYLNNNYFAVQLKKTVFMWQKHKRARYEPDVLIHILFTLNK